MIGKMTHIFRTRGITGLIRAIKFRMCGLLAGRAKSFPVWEHLFRGKKGLEVGGPSPVFARRGIFPVYPIVGHLDNCNFCNTTIWEGDIQQGQTFQFDSKKSAGQQYVAEASAMTFLSSGTYDFVLSSHVLEHTANPILVLTEWKRLLKNQGALVLILPHKDRTFDYRRPATTMEHLLADFDAGMTEDDLTHMPEILALHDLERDPEAGDFEAFKVRSMLNFENRCFHHHVFDTHLAAGLVNYMGMQIQAIEEIQPFHIVIVAQKMIEGQSPDNSSFGVGPTR